MTLDPCTFEEGDDGKEHPCQAATSKEIAQLLLEHGAENECKADSVATI